MDSLIYLFLFRTKILFNKLLGVVVILLNYLFIYFFNCLNGYSVGKKNN